MTGFASKTRTALALGLVNILRAGSYRVGVKLGLNRVRRLRGVAPQGQFYYPVSAKQHDGPVTGVWQSSGLLFSHWPIKIGLEPPDWLANPLTGKRVAADKDWWLIPDFDAAVGDIKLIWELSRMDWVPALATAARQGDSSSLEKLNLWIGDWCAQNPPYKGPNWKCGQEASIRVVHMAMAALILGQIAKPSRALQHLIELHLQRIEPTVQYAMAQDNNHGTSEAAALYIGGSWLHALGVPPGERWAAVGRHWLENRAIRLVGAQGSFSQYSLNYHRLMLDTYCMAEVWRRHLSLPAFSSRLMERMLAATEWLRHMINPLNGSGPNVGANDGARLIPLTETGYGDYRPTVQMGSVLFAGRRAFTEGPWDGSLHVLGVKIPEHTVGQVGDYLADDGGFAILRRDACMAMLRYPRFRFRPSQADVLHLDLWLGGNNVLRDAGTYSYNTDPQLLKYFSGTESHNTVQFDDRDQMPRLGRFLFSNWLKTSFLDPLEIEEKSTSIAAGYKDYKGASHRRYMKLGDNNLVVTDNVEGFSNKAILRWRLIPGEWNLEQTADGLRIFNKVDQPILEFMVSASVPIARAELVDGWESRYYLDKVIVPVLEIEIQQPGVLTTKFQWLT